MNDTKIITQYIAVWMWQIITMLFVVTFVISLMLEVAWGVLSFALLSVITEIIAMKRKKQLTILLEGD